MVAPLYSVLRSYTVIVSLAWNLTMLEKKAQEIKKVWNIDAGRFSPVLLIFSFSIYFASKVYAVGCPCSR